MDFIRDLEKIIAFQNTNCSSAAEVLATLGTPDASIAILDEDRISSHCFTTQKSDENTLFQACSISKPMAATATFRAVQAGKLSLTAPITNYLSSEQLRLISSPGTENILPNVTIEMLLSHTSGLAVHGFGGYAKDPPSIPTVLGGGYPSNSMPVRLEGLPGHCYSYSGGGYTVLQLILETVFHEPFSKIMQDLLFKPLDMKRSFYALAPGEENYAKAFHTGYTQCDPPYHVYPELAAAGLWTTPGDLLRVVRAIQSSLNSKNDSFLQAKWARLMLTEVQESMARGWAAPKGSGTFAHGGSNDPGYRCYLIGFANLEHDRAKAAPVTDCGVCVMTNSAQGFELSLKIVMAATCIKNWPAFPPRSILGLVPFASWIAVDARWEEWAGKWSKDWEILLGEGRVPMVKFQRLAPLRLYSASVPAKMYQEGSSIDLVVGGLEMMFRLGWEEGKRIVELWQGEVSKLEQVE